MPPVLHRKTLWKLLLSLSLEVAMHFKFGKSERQKCELKHKSYLYRSLRNKDGFNTKDGCDKRQYRVIEQRSKTTPSRNENNFTNQILNTKSNRRFQKDEKPSHNLQWAANKISSGCNSNSYVWVCSGTAKLKKFTWNIQIQRRCDHNLTSLKHFAGPLLVFTAESNLDVLEKKACRRNI